MKTITIDFTKNPVEISDTVLGHRGEKNATQLIITPPTSMSAPDSGIAYYCVAFQIGAHRVSHSELYAKAETITVPLERSVTQVNVLSLQLEGYDGEENLIIKSDMVDNLTFDESVDGEEYDCGDSHNLGAEVAAMKTKLNKFGEDEKGNLIYNGKPINSAERETHTVDIPNGYFYLSQDTTGNAYWLIDTSETFTENLEIKTISFLYNGEWIDIHEMYKLDGVPYAINIGRTFSISGGEMILAVITNFGIINTIMTVLNNYEIESMKVTCYTDGGAE